MKSYQIKTIKHYKTNKRKQAVKFFLKYSNKWHTYSNDYETINVITSLVNLKILNHNEFNQVKVNTHNAKLYLNQG